MNEGLNAQQRLQLAGHISERIAQLIEEISHLETLTQPVSPDVSIGRLTRLDALNELAVNEKALASARLRYMRLQTVQKQVQNAGFGDCHHCAEPIPFARLWSIPETQLCVACAEQAEH